MKSRIALLLPTLFLAATIYAADYGQKTTYKKDTPLIFPDCQLTYLGQHRVSSKAYPRGFLLYDFKATTQGATKDISWSSGTGEIAPLFFKVAGKKFVLELSHSDAFPGFLKPNELVLWTQPKFDALKRP